MFTDQSLESLFKLVHVLKRQLHKHADHLELGIAPMHVRVLKIINRKQSCTAIDIAGFLHRDKAQVTRLVTTLIEQNLIEKTPHPTDKRSHYLSITDAGMDVIKTISQADVEISKLMMQDLTPKEVADFQRITSKMAANLRSEGD